VFTCRAKSLCKILGPHSNADVQPCLLGCDTVSLDRWLPTFWDHCAFEMSPNNME
jgi:hypothetical protein